MRMKKWRCLKNLILFFVFLYILVFLWNGLFLEYKTSTDTKAQLCYNVSSSLKDIDVQRWIKIEQIIYTSALYVKTENPYIQVIGIKERTVSRFRPIFCQVWYRQRGSTIMVMSVEAIVKPMFEHRNKRYSGAFIECRLPQDITPFAPIALTLNKESCVNTSSVNIIPVIDNSEQTKLFTVCVTPLNFKYSLAYELVEMIELNLILGADLLVFYNYSTHRNVDKVLNHYKKQGLVEVVQWHLPVKVDTWPNKQEPEIHYFGQLPALNDCLYRNRLRSRYIVFQDIDEFIIPRKKYKWADMLNDLSLLHENTAVYMFRNAFFRKDWPHTNISFYGKDLALRYSATTLLKLKRETKLQEKSHRSKYIVNPQLVDHVGIHSVYRKSPRASSYFVEPEVALLHHYRDWANPDDKNRKEDTRLLQYSRELTQNLHKRWTKLADIPKGPL